MASSTRHRALLQLLQLLLGVAVGAALAAAAEDGDDAATEANRFSRLATYVRSYATRQGLNMMVSDDDIRCLLEAGRALRHDSAGVIPKSMVSLYNLVMRTTPRCKLSLIAKSRMFMSAEFAKGAMGILLNVNVNINTTTPPAA